MEPARQFPARQPGSPDPRPKLVRGRSVPAATEDDVRAMIDEAGASLDREDLTAVLVVLLREADLLRRGSLPARPRGRLREGRPALSPAARTHLRPIRIALAEVARSPGLTGPSDLVQLGDRLAAHVERVGGIPDAGDDSDSPDGEAPGSPSPG